MCRSECSRDSAERNLGICAVVPAEVEESFLASVFFRYDHKLEERGANSCPFTDIFRLQRFILATFEPTDVALRSLLDCVITLLVTIDAVLRLTVKRVFL